MKTYRIFFFLIILSQYSFSQQDSEKRYFKGEWTNLRNDKGNKEGKWIYSKDINSNADSIIFYKDGLKNGPSEYFVHSSRVLRKRLNYSNGKKHGTQVYWLGNSKYQSYQIAKIDNYNNNKLIDSKKFDVNRSLKFDLGFINQEDTISLKNIKDTDTLNVRVIVSNKELEGHTRVASNLKILSFTLGNVDCSWILKGDKFPLIKFKRCPWKQFWWDEALCENEDGIQFTIISNKRIEIKE